MTAAMLAAAGITRADVERQVRAPLAETQDGASALQKDGNWVVVPIPVSDPTFGSGLQLGVLYLHAATADSATAANTTSGVGLMATDNGSRVAGAFHDRSFANDRYRLSAFLGGGKLKFKYYGVGTGSFFFDNPIDYEFSGWVLQVRGLLRLRDDADWFAGLYLQQASADITFEITGLPVPDVSGDFRLGSLAPILLFDSRDDNYYPTQGEYFALRWFNYRDTWGSDFDFDRGDLDVVLYRSLTSNLVSAWRMRLQAASDATPFFALPTLDMRGFSRDRYRDAYAASVHAELRYKFLPRWGALAFVEAGRVADRFDALGDARTIVSIGGGLRWQVSADKPLHIGIYFAASTDDQAAFIQLGERF